MTRAVKFEINGNEPDRPRGVVTGVDIRPADFMALIETLAHAGWPIEQDALLRAYKDALDDVLRALQQTVEYIGTDALPAQDGWSWYDAMTSYAPNWPIPASRQSAGVQGTADAPSETAAPARADAGVDASTDVFAAWSHDGSATNFESYQKGWYAAFDLLIGELTKFRRIGETPSRDLSVDDLAFYQNHPLPAVGEHTVSGIIAWLKGKAKK